MELLIAHVTVPFRLLAAVLMLVALPAPAFSGNVSSVLELDTAARLNPLGAAFYLNAYQRNVYQRHPSTLWDGLYVQGGVQANINGAFVRAGLYLEWMPIAVLQLRVQLDRYHFNGSYGSLLAFDDVDSAYGDEVLAGREGDEQTAYGSRYSLRPTLRAKFGHYIVRNEINYYHYRFPGAGPYYLDRESEILLAQKDDLFLNNLNLLYEMNGENGGTRSLAGPFYEYARARESGIMRQLLGISLYREPMQRWQGFTHPRWYMQAGYYLQEPNRQGQFYGVVGFGADLR